VKLQGKTALVTGGGTGIGKAIVQRFVAEGANVCISGRRKELLEETAASLPAGRVVVCAGDASKEDDVARMVETSLKISGRLDVLVNNAAIATTAPITEMARDMWHKVLDINLTGPFMLMQEAIPHMIKAGGGSIINIASLGGLRSLPSQPAYCTSKAGLIMLTQQAALDYGVHNIRVNAVCPGGVKTDMIEREFGQIGRSIGLTPDAFFALVSKVLPLRRFAEPQEIGGICTFLASDDSSFVTGAALVIDAGTAVVDTVGAEMMGLVRRHQEQG